MPSHPFDAIVSEQYNSVKVAVSVGKKRIQAYADPETKRRVELAAAKCPMAVTEYCLAAIRQQLAEDDMPEYEQINMSITPNEDDTLIADLRVLHQEILAHRRGELIDVDQHLSQMREERAYELANGQGVGP